MTENEFIDKIVEIKKVCVTSSYQIRSVGGGGKLMIRVPTNCFTLMTRVSSFFAKFSKTLRTNLSSRKPEEQFSINLEMRLP